VRMRIKVVVGWERPYIVVQELERHLVGKYNWFIGAIVTFLFGEAKQNSEEVVGKFINGFFREIRRKKTLLYV